MPDKLLTPSQRMQDSLNNTFFRSTDPDKQKKDGDVYCLPIAKLVPFSQHPFKLYTGDKLAEMAESIKERGVVCPIIVRKQDDEQYEIIAGHNRVEAAKLSNLADIPAIIREVDDDTATLMMIESNLNQRENILPSERGQAYKLQLETLNRKGHRTLYQNGTRLDSLNDIAANNNDSRTQVTRFIRLTSLISDLSDMVDDGKLNFTFGVDLSYLSPEHQQTVYELIQDKTERINAALQWQKTLKTAANAIKGKHGLTQAISDLLIEKVRVFPDNRIEIEWKYADFAKPNRKGDKLEKSGDLLPNGAKRRFGNCGTANDIADAS
ncbi:MAG: ParB/RepB/Spo0J family partition protein [Oscillospiraceae bacterium]|jgi:ParB family chromosome partitioning protein|nr:ParB/RepB/Spo0J family partition protein [Oscillospiraceae bacterium]